MERNIKSFLSLMLAFVMVFGLIPANVFATGAELAAAEPAVEITADGGNVAKIGDAEYATLAEAIAAVQNGDTIVLLADVAGDVTITQKKNVAFTIDGDGHTLTGAMTIEGTGYAGDQNQGLTIKNLKFIVGDYGIYAYKKNNYARNVTIDGCAFESAAGDTSGYGIAVRHVYNFTIKNTTGSGLFDFFYAGGAIDRLNVENVTVTDTQNAFFMAYGTKLNFTNVTTSNVDYGISIKNQTNNGTATITDCNLSGGTAVLLIVANPANTYNLIFKGNTLVDSEDWLVVADNDGNLITDEESNPFNVQKNGDEDAEEDVTIVIPVPDVAEVNGVGYTTLTDAIAAANSGDTITLLADITEDVTVNKNVTIEGAAFSYTGMMKVNSGLTVTVQNVNFVNGCIDKVKGTKGTLTVKDCTFDGTGSNYYYAVTMRGGAKVVTENCQSKGFVYGFLYTPSAVTNVSVKNVAVTECGMGINITYGSKITLENVTMTDVGYGIQSHNYGAKTFTMTNCDISGEKAIFAWERTENAVVDTFVFQGTGNKLSGEVVTNGHAVLKLADIDATLTAPEGLTVTTDAGEQYKVIYEEGVYKVALRVYVAEVNGEIFESIQEAVNAANDGDTILVIADHEIACDAETLINVVGKDITIDLNGKAVTVNADAEQAARVVFRTEADAKLTIQDSVGTGSVIANGEGVLHYMFRNEGEMIVKSGSYELSALTGGAMFFSTNSNMLVEGGNFKQTTKGWMFNAIGNGANVITAVGGTFNRYFIGGEAFNENEWNEVVIPSIYALSDNGDGTWTITAAVCYNTNTGFGYASLNEAAAAAKDGENIVLLADIAENAVIDGKSISLELNRMYMTGEITLASADAALTAAKDLNVVTSVADAKVVYENGTYMVKLLQYVAQIGETKYDDLSDALAAAKSGETVQVIANTAEFLVMVPAEVKLDLNGFVVTAKNVLAFGIVMDTAAEVGGIKISNDTTKAFTKLQPENGGYLPIYDTRDGMYKFFEHEVVSVDVVAGEDDAKFRFQLRFEDKAAYEVLANTADSDVSYVLNLMWTGMEDYTVRYRMTDATVRAYAASVYEQMSDAENPENTRKMTLTIYGVNALGTGGYVSAVPSVETVAEVTSTADMLRHENP